MIRLLFILYFRIINHILHLFSVNNGSLIDRLDHIIMTDTLDLELISLILISYYCEEVELMMFFRTKEFRYYVSIVKTNVFCFYSSAGHMAGLNNGARGKVGVAGQEQRGEKFP